MEKQKYSIPVIRTGYGCKNIEVEATSQEEAEQLALNEAGDYEFSEHDSDYAIDNDFVALTEKDLEKIYHILDGECISETENVSMTTIREIFAKFGADPKKMQ